MDEATLCAGLLHDTIEDGYLERENGENTRITANDITPRFGEVIAQLVEG